MPRKTVVDTTKWTLVQHSAYGYKSDPTFKDAVEERMLDKARDVSRVAAAGGLLFNNYGEAEDRAMHENYPAQGTANDDGSLIPRVRGTFSSKQVDGLRIYVPCP